MTAADLLPDPAAFERALAEATADDLPVPIDQILDPYETPSAFLPFLAAHWSVDLWFDDWAEARKREMIAQSAGRSTIHPGERLAELKGTREGLKRFLAFVDAEIVRVVSHPCRFVVGRSGVGWRPIAHPPLTAHYLVKLPLQQPAHAFEINRAAIGRASLRSVDLEPIRRAKLAMTVGKAPETLYSVTFAWRRHITLSDSIPLDGSHHIGGFVDRTRL
ncbi:phage tail protein I [Amorphus orientalis]|uniref:P2-related tail formation protein n=1 Tax=Amorphus orientalis TaxID=649198 RepID=A0AAE3VMW5_9HYPH|nr:phage tail protein I [Amorphus orientalis]MDQ0314853.1 P2-related tail formation protein [Amorphus orientalis]